MFSQLPPGTTHLPPQHPQAREGLIDLGLRHPSLPGPPTAGGPIPVTLKCVAIDLREGAVPGDLPASGPLHGVSEFMHCCLTKAQRRSGQCGSGRHCWNSTNQYDILARQ